MRFLSPLLLPLSDLNNSKELTPSACRWKAQTFNHRYQVFVSVSECTGRAEMLPSQNGNRREMMPQRQNRAGKTVSQKIHE